jgi:hypothetical protein
VTGENTCPERRSSSEIVPLARMVSSMSCVARGCASIFASFTCCGVSHTSPAGGWASGDCADACDR